MRKVIFLLLATFLIALASCGTAEKAAAERRNLMMPKKHELPKNRKYKAPKANKKIYYKQRS